MNPRVAKLRKMIQEGSQLKPLVFLDTGAIIDFEREIKLWKLKDSSYNTEKWYEELAKDMNFYVTEDSLREINRHGCQHCINGRPEISPKTLDIITNFHSAYCKLIKETAPTNPVNLNEICWNTYWACKLTFPESCKKGSLDLISFCDRSMVLTALWVRYALTPEGKSLTDSSIILSPDEHLSGTVRTLMDRNRDFSEIFGKFNYDGVRVITSRY